MVNRVKSVVCLGLCSLFLLTNVASLYATPSTTYWTPCTSDVQPYGKIHIGADNYTTIGRKDGEKGDFATDFGLTTGVLPFEKLNLEIGVDLLEPSENPVYFNAKLGTPENSIFEGSPALNVGIFNVGTKDNVTDYNIAYFVIGKTLPMKLGRLHAGYYNGDSQLLRNSAGEVEDDGFMVAYDRFIYKDKIMLAADYMSGKNAVGAGGVGLYYFFTPDISLLAGPVWFNDEGLNGNMKWTLQLDINLDTFSNLFKKNK